MMSVSTDIAEEAEFAKSKLMASKIDDRTKKQIFLLLNIAAAATNGLSLEEKVLKITEIMLGLIVSQVTFLDGLDLKIAKANNDQCSSCKAFKAADELEDTKMRTLIIEQWKAANGFHDDTQALHSDDDSTGWKSMAKAVLTNPGFWIFASLLVLSPYSVQIILTIGSLVK